MVDLKAVFECPGTQNSALKCGRYSSIYFCSTKVCSFEIGESLPDPMSLLLLNVEQNSSNARTLNPNFALRDIQKQP